MDHATPDTIGADLETTVLRIRELSVVEEDEKEALERTLCTQGLTPALKERLDALFDAELKAAEAELEDLGNRHAKLESDLAAAISEAAPGYQQNAATLKADVSAALGEFGRDANRLAGEQDRDEEAVQREDESAEADAIRRSLKGDK